jgi:hypothetical protein
VGCEMCNCHFKIAARGGVTRAASLMTKSAGHSSSNVPIDTYSIKTTASSFNRYQLRRL